MKKRDYMNLNIKILDTQKEFYFNWRNQEQMHRRSGCIIKKNFPKEDRRDKQKLAKTARNIFDEFDRNNANNIFSFMDFTKIIKQLTKL